MMMMMMTTTSTKTKLAIERKTDKALLKYGRMAENRQSESVAYFMRMRCMVDRETVAPFFPLRHSLFFLFHSPFETLDRAVFSTNEMEGATCYINCKLQTFHSNEYFMAALNQ